MGTKNYIEVAAFFPEEIKGLLLSLDDLLKNDTYEIRVRAEKPIVLFGRYGMLFLKSDYSYSSLDTSGSYIVNEKQLHDLIISICNYSVYSHQNDIANGFVTFGKGNRAGFAGKAVIENGKVVMISNISSVNIRISSGAISLDSDLLNVLFDFRGLIICGPPCSGKTTILREIAVELSSSYSFGFSKVAVIDERYELCCRNAINCDILSGFPKDYGIDFALRTLSPDVIILDEITTVQQVEMINNGLYSGVRFALSMHCFSVTELLKKNVSLKLIRSGFFDKIILLDKGKNTGKVKSVIKTEELISGKFDCSDSTDHFNSDCLYNYQK